MRLRAVFFLVLTLFYGVCSWAGAFNQLGFGARNKSMGNATVGMPVDAFSQAYNPALMAFQPDHVFSIGLEGVTTSFTNINHVITNTPALGASAVTYGDISTSTPDVMLYTIGYVTSVYEGHNPLRLGIIFIAPVQRLFEVETPDDFQPSYSMYTTDMQRLVPSVSLAMALTDNFSIGIEGNVYVVSGVSSHQTLPAGGNSTSDYAMDVRTGIAPEAGVYWAITPQISTGFSYRGKEDYRSQINVDATISLLGPNDLLFTNNASLDYDPDMFLTGVTYKDDSHNTYALAAKLELWNGFSGGAVQMNFQGSYTGSFSQTLPSTPFHNTLSGHFGYQHEFSHSQIRGGYAYVPTPVPDPNQYQYSNILDANKHELYAGWGYKWDKTILDGTLALDLVGFVDYLVPINVTKNDSQAIGYPGYSIGGIIMGYGLTVTREY
jgi:long-subunit fatty acid transport protein